MTDGKEQALARIIERTGKFLAAHPEVSQEKLAKTVGISGSALSGFLAGKYKGQSDAVAYKIESALDAQESREASIMKVKEPGIVETGVMKKMCFGLNYARDRRDIIIICGASGIGKTVTLKRWLKENPASISFTASPNIGTKKAVMEETLSALNKNINGRCDRLQRAIVAALKNTNRPIAIDEAQFLNFDALETLRSIHDATHCPLVLVGNPKIMQKITEQNEGITAQFFSRTVRFSLDEKISLEDVKAIILQNGMRLDDECLEEFHKIASSKGGAFRTMVKVFTFVWSLANKCKEAISLDHIFQAESYVAGEAF
jgi:DNA transposition AAA+ family ATPase